MISKLAARALSGYCRRFPPHRGMYRMVKYLSALCPDQPVTSRYGIQLVCRPRDLTFHYAALGAYGDLHEVLLGLLKPGMCFIDIGANQGVFTVLASRAIGPEGRVLCFEPSHREFVDLLRNLALNQADNVLPFLVGLSDVSTTGFLHTGSDTHSGLGHYSEEGGQLSLQLDLRSCDLIVEALVGSRDCVVKIDVEGFELRAIRSMGKVLIRPATQAVVFEIDQKLLASQRATVEEIYQAMADCGFEPLRGMGSARHYDEVFRRGR